MSIIRIVLAAVFLLPVLVCADEPDSLESITKEPDSVFVIPAGPLAGTVTDQARVTVVDTIAGWAKIYIEGWVPVSVALPYLSEETGFAPSPQLPLQETDRQCEAITKKGTRCKRKAMPGSRYCWQHQPKK